ncbi:hypothetical protein MMC14_009579, partial [Varicellaria rhodocarpa]|nr:hypothetical protein [Varicellaria rhodocarpa]
MSKSAPVTPELKAIFQKIAELNRTEPPARAASLSPNNEYSNRKPTEHTTRRLEKTADIKAFITAKRL